MNLYENMRCHGVPLVTISRGRVVYENGVFMCAEGTGKFCPLRSFPDAVYKKLVQREKVGAGGRAQQCHAWHVRVRRGTIGRDVTWWGFLRSLHSRGSPFTSAGLAHGHVTQDLCASRRGWGHGGAAMAHPPPSLHGHVALGLCWVMAELPAPAPSSGLGT